MIAYLLQIDGTERDKWQTISAETPQDAIVKAIRPLIKQGKRPTQAYVALGKAKAVETAMYQNYGALPVYGYERGPGWTIIPCYSNTYHGQH